MLPGIIPSMVVGTSFPRVVDQATTVITTPSTTHTLNLPASTRPGDLLLAFLGHIGVSTIAGWSPLDTSSTQFRIATGSDPNTLTVPAASMLHAVVYRIIHHGGDPYSESVTPPADTIQDPPPVMTPWPQTNCLWFASTTFNSGTVTIDTIPTNYTDFTFMQPPAGANAAVGVCRRTLNALSENPSHFVTSSSVGTRTRTTAVPGRPLGARVFRTRSIRFNPNDPNYMTCPITAGTSRRKGAYSVWIKRSTFNTTQYVMEAYADPNNRTAFQINTDNTISFVNFTGGVLNAHATSIATFTNPAAWTHFVWQWDTTVGNNNLSLTINGVNSPLTFTTTLAQNTDLWFGTAGVTLQSGRYGGSPGYAFAGYKFDEYLTDGQAFAPFGQFNVSTGIWEPAKYTGSFGAGGGHWDFSNNSSVVTVGLDSSGTNNHFTLSSGFILGGRDIDSFVDTPVLVDTNINTNFGNGNELRSNYSTYNSLDATTYMGVNEGALVGWGGNAALWSSVRATRYVNSGKWYWEVQPSNLVVGTNNICIGILGPATMLAGSGEASIYVGMQNDGYSWVSDGNKYNGGVSVAYSPSYLSDSSVGVALDLDAGTLTFYNNGVSKGVAYSGLVGSFAPAVSAVNGTYVFMNFGQKRFTYPAPPNFKLFCASYP